MAKVFLHEQTNNIIGEKGSSAKLTVNCPEGSLVTVSKDGMEYTSTADTGSAIFKNLTHGTWTVTISKDGENAVRSVDIVTDYEIQISFFVSYINILYPDGAVCTVTDGNKTYTAPDTSGQWTCIVSSTGTYTVTCTDGSETKTKDVMITGNNQTENVELAFFAAIINVTYPQGAICSCSNGLVTYSASDTTGSWRFVVPKAGTWTITATDGIQTLTEDVEIVDDGQEAEVIFRFFAATLNITYPSGANCTVTDGTTTFTAPDTSGTWTATLPRTGVWTVKATSGNKTVTKTIEITEDGQTENVTCKFFASYINVTYPTGTFKLVLWYIDDYGNKQELAVDSSGNGSCKFIVAQTGKYEVGAYRVIPYVGIETTPGDYDGGTANITKAEQTVNIKLSYNTIPKFTYTGNYKIVNDSGNTITETTSGWNIYFLTSGVFKCTKLNGATKGIDLFVVGGGGNGGNPANTTAGGRTYTSGGGGGGGGYRESSLGLTLKEGTEYQITIGGSGGSTSAFGSKVNGGGNGSTGTIDNYASGGSGGSSGGQGGYNAVNGTSGEDGSYPFGEYSSTAKRYGPGGGGGRGYNGRSGDLGSVGLGGKDGGGKGNSSGSNSSYAKATANSGGGGGGGSTNAGTVWYMPGAGGSGIVIIRNKR